MKFVSTRGGVGGRKYTFEECLFSSLAHDGGMFLPESIPALDAEFFQALKGKSYPEVCHTVLSLFIGEEVPGDDLQACIDAAFSKFANPEVVPVAHVDGAGVHVVELWWGPTLAFKDLGLQLIGQLLELFLRRRRGRATIVVGTSGDTGSAAIQGVLGLDAVDIVVLYPHGLTSDAQRLQMVTVDAPNVHVFATAGTSDDLDVPIKAVFNDSDFCAEHSVMSANSINVARILIQMVHFFYTWAKLADTAAMQPVSFVVPTGAAGHVTAGVLAKLCGLPVHRLVAATNCNDIMHSVVSTGCMHVSPAGVVPTTSPSMDIQSPYNVERMLYLLMNSEHPELVAELITAFDTTGRMDVPAEWADQWVPRLGLASVAIPEDEVKATIASIYEDFKYVVDPHTAVGVAAALAQADAWDGGVKTPVAVMATAHAAKFEEAMTAALSMTSDSFRGLVFEGRDAAATSPLAALHGLPSKATPMPKESPEWQADWTRVLREKIVAITAARTATP